MVKKKEKALSDLYFCPLMEWYEYSSELRRGYILKLVLMCPKGKRVLEVVLLAGANDFPGRRICLGD